MEDAGRLLQVFLCINLLWFLFIYFFCSPGWLLTRLSSVYGMHLLKDVSWSADNPEIVCKTQTNVPVIAERGRLSPPQHWPNRS